MRKSEYERITARLAHLYHTTQPEMARKIAAHAKAGRTSPLALARKLLSDTRTFTPRRIANATVSQNLLPPNFTYDELLATAKSISKESRRHPKTHPATLH
ncbi:MAG: hypothetical protein ACI4RT_01010 [Candidatus Spyradenecus sp.]